MTAKAELLCGDCLELMRGMPDDSVDLVLTDPPYHIGCTTKKNGRKVANAWDRIDGYIDWSICWLQECQRVLRPTGVLYFFAGDMRQIPELLCAIKARTRLDLASFCIWDKGDSYRAQSWRRRDPASRTAPRAWFSVCEYCLHFFNRPAGCGTKGRTRWDRANSDPACYRPIKEWYAREKERLGLSEKQIEEKYTEATGRKPYMLRHYWRDSQFEIPTKEVYEAVYEPLGFAWPGESGQQGYEGLRREYEGLRNVHICDEMHCNIWHIPQVPTQHRLHTCQKPVELLERLCRVSSRPGAVVLDPFMGSGSTGVACANTGRSFVGIEQDPETFATAKRRIEETGTQLRLPGEK